MSTVTALSTIFSVFFFFFLNCVWFYLANGKGGLRTSFFIPQLPVPQNSALSFSHVCQPRLFLETPRLLPGPPRFVNRSISSEQEKQF